MAGIETISMMLTSLAADAMPTGLLSWVDSPIEISTRQTEQLQIIRANEIFLCEKIKLWPIAN